VAFGDFPFHRCGHFPVNPFPDRFAVRLFLPVRQVQLVQVANARQEVRREVRSPDSKRAAKFPLTAVDPVLSRVWLHLTFVEVRVLSVLPRECFSYSLPRNCALRRCKAELDRLFVKCISRPKRRVRINLFSSIHPLAAKLDDVPKKYFPGNVRQYMANHAEVGVVRHDSLARSGTQPHGSDSRLIHWG